MIARINAFAKHHGCIAGVCGAERLDHTLPHLKSRFTPFVSADIEKRIEPEKVLPGLKSIIVLGKGYDPGGNGLSSLATNFDYHTVLSGLLHELAEILNECKPIQYKILVDSGTLPERELAVKANLGGWGRSCMVISAEWGPFFNIGLLLTDIPLSELGQIPCESKHTCPADCRLCVEACPTQAIAPEGFKMEVTRCVSYLTQKKGVLSETEMKAIGTHLYGCDDCALACPVTPGFHPQRGNQPPSFTLLYELLTLDESTFSARFGNSAMAWRGLDVLRRNALIAAGNTPWFDEKERNTLYALARSFLDSPDAGVAAAATYTCLRLSEKGDNGDGLLEHARPSGKRL